MNKNLRLFGVALLVVGMVSVSGCGKNDGTPAGNGKGGKGTGNGALNGGTGDTDKTGANGGSCGASGNFVGSCNQGTACTDYYATAAATTNDIREACDKDHGTVSTNLCKSDNVLGTCAIPLGPATGVLHFYAGQQGLTVELVQQVCAQSQGTYCAN